MNNVLALSSDVIYQNSSGRRSCALAASRASVDVFDLIVEQIVEVGNDIVGRALPMMSRICCVRLTDLRVAR